MRLFSVLPFIANICFSKNTFMNFRVSVLFFLFVLPIALCAQSAASATNNGVKKHTTKKHRRPTKPGSVGDGTYNNAVTAKSPSVTAATNQAFIKFTETSYNFGEIKQGDTVKYDFEFTNTGKSELLILEAEATCGCTHPSYPFIPIAPGETGKIGVTFNSAGKMGVQRPSITVTTNGIPKTIKVNLEGVVR
jgi:hypothetical protein